MRHLIAGVLALSSLAGCGTLGLKSRPAPSHDVGHTPRGAPAAELVYLDVALVERPRGDAFLDRDVWGDGDEQGVDLEIKPILEANGLRVAQFGLLPDRLQTLLSSPRSCPAPRRLRGEPDRPIQVPVGSERASCKFQIRPDEANEVNLTKARCEFTVVATPDEDGAIRFRFTPRIKHGQAQIKPHVARDPDGQLRWAVEPTEPTEEYGELRFDLVVGAGEFVVLGTRSDWLGTLGHAIFVPEGEQPVQYLLVLRATRVPPGGKEPVAAVAPLAVQASRPAIRGSSR